MTVRILTAPLKHPSECDVCGGRKIVKVSRVLPVGWHPERDLAGLIHFKRAIASRHAMRIPCPQCTGAEELLAHLPRTTGAGTSNMGGTA